MDSTSAPTVGPNPRSVGTWKGTVTNTAVPAWRSDGNVDAFLQDVREEMADDAAADVSYYRRLKKGREGAEMW